MIAKQNVTVSRVEPSGSSYTWWLVLKRELAEQWIGGKALTLIILFSFLLGIMSYVLASNSELSLIPPKEMVWLTLEAAIATGVFIGLIIGADGFSGERERATLEALLLTPTSRRQIVVGKFLAAISPWPVALAISIPYLKVLSQGDEVFGQAMLWGSILGSLLALAFTAVGMTISVFASSNKTSLLVSLVVYLLCLLPTQFPGNAQTGTYGRMLKRVNPMEANNHFLEKILVNNRTLDEFWSWLIAPVLFCVLALGVLFLYAAPGLRLEGGRASMIGSLWKRIAQRGRVAGLGILVIAGLMASLWPSPALALLGKQAQVAELPLEIAIDMDHAVVKNGEKIEFNTVVTNNGTEPSPPLIVAMNIINLDGAGDPVDPEDWSPQRTQALEALAPGKSAKHSWRVNTILEGDYMVYMVIVPTPDGPQATSKPITSSGIHVTVERFVRLNPGGVVPYAIVVPIVLVVGSVFLARYRRRQIDAGGS